MSWDLALVVDLVNDADRWKLVASLLDGPMGAGAGDEVELQWVEHARALHRNERSSRLSCADAIRTLPRFFEELRATNFVTIGWIASRKLGISVCALGPQAVCTRGVRSSLEISLGDAAVWSPAALASPGLWESSNLADGSTTGTTLLVETVRKLAAHARIRNLRVLAEQEVHDRVSQHLAFHSDPREFLDDLVEILKLGLHGGTHYTKYDERRPFATEYDSRSEMTSIVDAPDDAYFVWLGRRKAARAVLREALTSLGPLVDQHGIPPDLDAAWVRDQLRQAPDCVLFESDGGGLGVHDHPFLGTNYLDGPYLTLLRAVAAKLGRR